MALRQKHVQINIRDAWQRFGDDTRGAIAILFAFCIIVLVVAAGIAVDISRAVVVRQRLVQAMDAAALAVGSVPNITQREAEDMAQKYFDANYPVAELGVPGKIVTSLNDATVQITGSATVARTLTRIIGFDDIEVGAMTEVALPKEGVEVVMVLDNTGSMGGATAADPSKSKLDALKDAANILIDELFASAKTSGAVKIGLVPFANTVNIGADKKNSGWMDLNGDAPHAADNFDFDKATKTSSHETVWDLFDTMPNVEWKGCVEARATPYDLNDAEPDPNLPRTLFQPYFYPDEPNDPGSPGTAATDYVYSYLEDPATGTPEERQADTAKYTGKDPVDSVDRGPNYLCNVEEITPLTSVKQDVVDAIGAMHAGNTTNIPLGVIWGWRAISPGEPFSQGVAYNSNIDKIVILLSDGNNVISGLPSGNRSYYTSYGYLSAKRLGTEQSSVAFNKLNMRTTTICDRMKGEGIVIYTIAFDVMQGSAADQLMSDCASEPKNYFNSPDPDELTKAFKAISRDILALRVSK